MTSSVAAAMAPSRSGWLNDEARAETPADDISLLWRFGAVEQTMVCTHHRTPACGRTKKKKPPLRAAFYEDAVASRLYLLLTSYRRRGPSPRRPSHRNSPRRGICHLR